MLIVILETPKTIFVNLFLPQKYINLDFLKIGQFLMDQEWRSILFYYLTVTMSRLIITCVRRSILAVDEFILLYLEAASKSLMAYVSQITSSYTRAYS